MEKKLSTRIVHKHDIEANWLKAVNFVPKQGELVVYDIDDNYNYERVKIGDGVTTVSDLPFIDARKADVGHIHEVNDVDGLSDVISELSDSILVNYDESIIGLSVDGCVITYIKGDGSEHTIITQDTDTTYSLGTDTVTGLTKLYATIGSAEDGTMTQKAIKTELDKKVGVSVDNAQNALIFTI